MERTGTEEQEREAGLRILEDQTGAQAPQLESWPRHETSIDFLLLTFRMLSLLTVISALLCTFVNVISVVRSFKYRSTVFEGILRCYAVIIALFVAIAETEWRWIMKFSRVLEYWAGRGMLQLFVAVMTKALSRERKENRLETVLSDVASWMLLSCGVVYVIAGILCIGRIKESRIQKSQWREQAFKELQDIERKRKELQGLLSGNG